MDQKIIVGTWLGEMQEDGELLSIEVTAVTDTHINTTTWRFVPEVMALATVGQDQHTLEEVFDNLQSGTWTIVAIPDAGDAGDGE